jgi:hypothetical protein
VTGPTGPTGPTGTPGAQGAPGAAGSLSTSVSALGVNIAAGATGTLQATGTITAGYSDIRLKDNIESIKNAGEKLYQLSGVLYTQNKLAEQFGYHSYESQVGLIAQEVQKVVPEIVRQAPFDIDQNGESKSGENYLTVQYEKLIPLIVETVKEQQREIEQLEGALI